MYKMREGLAEFLKKRGYSEEINASELNQSDIELLKEVVADCTHENEVNWENVSLYMQFDFKVYPTGWEKVFNELN